MNTKKNSIAGYQHITHTFGPVFDADSEILILGSLPSVQSRAQQFYYGHPQNRFWKVLAALTKESIPLTIPEKKQLLLKHQIALWDVIQRCEIIGSSDSSIRNVVPADIPSLLEQSSITAIFGNGSKACELFKKYTPFRAAAKDCKTALHQSGKCSMEFGAADTYMGCRNFSCRYCASGKMELLVSLENREKIL